MKKYLVKHGTEIGLCWAESPEAACKQLQWPAQECTVRRIPDNPGFCATGKEVVSEKI